AQHGGAGARYGGARLLRGARGRWRRGSRAPRWRKEAAAMKSAIVGIDLGTTFSLVATMKDGAPIVLPNALGELLTPSAVSLADDGTVLVGAPARARATTHPTRTALGFKRDMGTDKTIDLGLRRMSPPELSALVLATLKRDAESALGCAVEEA